MEISKRLSVPHVIKEAKLDEEQFQTLILIADVLIGETEIDPLPSSLEKMRKSLEIAVAARTRNVSTVYRVLSELAGYGDHKRLDDALRALSKSDPDDFQLISSIVAGAYFMLPEIKVLIGYPGQVRDFPKVDDAFNDLEDGILDPVIARGSIYVVAEGE
jgi:hypothetical protein